MKQIALTLALLILICSNAQARCIVNQDCTFEYVPVKISDGYSRDATLTLVTPNDIDLRYVYDNDSSITVLSTQADTCPPPNSGACMTMNGGGGWYRITVDSLLIPSSKAGHRLCLDIQDVQGTRTVPDMILCQDVEEGGTVWDTYDIVDLTNEGGDQNPTTTSSDTNLTGTVNFTATTPMPIMYFPTTAEDARQSTGCTLQGLRTEVIGYNVSTKIITYRALPSAPEYTCIFRIY